MAFVSIAGLVTYAPVFKDFLYKGLEQLFHDNIMYLELRTGLSRVSTVGLNQKYIGQCSELELHVTLAILDTSIFFPPKGFW
jgi:hypothetical protein